jgi:hypothetical protein
MAGFVSLNRKKLLFGCKTKIFGVIGRIRLKEIVCPRLGGRKLQDIGCLM